MHTRTNIHAAPAVVRIVSSSMRKKGAAIPNSPRFGTKIKH